MYSVVLMAALSGSPATPAWGVRGHCHGCGWGGHSCGHGWGGWSGSGWNGGLSWCQGPQGGCPGYFGAYPPIGQSFCSYCGCFAGYGGYGNGGFGYGGGYGGYGSGGFANGGGYGCWCGGCYCGCFSANGCYGGFSGWGPNAPPGVVPFFKEAPPRKEIRDAKPRDEQSETRARLIVQVPADAKVYIDGKLMTSTSERRVYGTPALQPGQIYFYDITAELVHDGQTISDTRRVYLRSGQVTEASFGDMIPAATTAGNEE